MSEDTIHQACKKGNLDRVKELVAFGVGINEADEEGYTPLCRSVKGNNINVVQYLLEAGADPNLVGSHKYKHTPLILAISRGNLEVAVCLLDNNASVNMGDCNNCPPLWWATGHVEIMELLISRGADIHKADKNGWTPLYESCKNGHCNTATVLLQHGADPAACDNSGHSTLYAAALQGKQSTVKLLLQQNVQIEKDIDGKTPLDAARWAMQLQHNIENKTTKANYEMTISMLEKYATEQTSQSNKNKTDEKEKQKQGPEIDTKEKVEDKTKESGSESVTEKNAEESKDLKNEIENEKTESCIIEQGIAENVLAANARMREQEREVKEMFQGTEADDYLRDIYKKISNIGKEIKNPETTKCTDDVLTDKHLMKMASKMEGQWKIIGGFLGVKNSEIKELASEHQTESKYAAWCMLVAWRDSAEGNVRDKIQTLKGALLDVDREDIADML